MFGSFNTKKSLPSGPTPSRHNALDCIPVKIPHLTEQPDADGDLRLIYPVQVKPWFQGIFQKMTHRQSSVIHRKLQLDALGTSVWHTIDGRKTVEELIDLFQRTHQLPRREAEISVCAFLRELGKRGLIAMQEKGIRSGSRQDGA